MLPLHFFALAIFAAIGLLLNWHLEKVLHNHRLASKRLRIHVNGIRGKSTVTRIIAGMLRHAKLHTVAKTTGSAACIIDRNGLDHSIRRIGSPTILEQVGIVQGLEENVEALVIECMAIKPEYQKICEEKIIQSNIGIITNVREDHQDILGYSLEEIASNLLLTCPRNGVLITTERNPRLLPFFERAAAANGTKLIIVDEATVTDEDLNAFSYVAFKENIAIGFALAELLQIDRSIAIQGMANASPDPGVLRVSHKHHRGVDITWADLFAVNDKESVIACSKRVSKLAPQTATRIGLLNNRSNREQRAIQFATISAQDLNLDFIVLLGAYEKQVEKELLKLGFEQNRILRLGSHRNFSGAEIVESTIAKARSSCLLIFGLVNIHTRQAEAVRHWFQNEQGGKF